MVIYVPQILDKNQIIRLRHCCPHDSHVIDQLDQVKWTLLFVKFFWKLDQSAPQMTALVAEDTMRLGLGQDIVRVNGTLVYSSMESVHHLNRVFNVYQVPEPAISGLGRLFQRQLDLVELVLDVFYWALVDVSTDEVGAGRVSMICDLFDALEGVDRDLEHLHDLRIHFTLDVDKEEVADTEAENCESSIILCVISLNTKQSFAVEN